MKDNDQTANLGALIDAGVRSFKIEGRYKDMSYVKNITAHYRQMLMPLLKKPAIQRALHQVVLNISLFHRRKRLSTVVAQIIL